jgi:alkylated DNA repair dioxygenase AlkB
MGEREVNHPQMTVLFVESFLAVSEAEALFASVQSLPWTRGKFMGGFVPREEVWIGPYAYKFSGRTLEPGVWIPEIAAIRDRIRAQYGGNYNSVLLNRYANAQDSVSWHSDDEPEMDSKHPIGSLSLGAARAFLIKPIKPIGPIGPITNQAADKKAVQTFVLTSGSLLVMPPGFQQRYQHCVPKSKTPCGPRVNLTFRRMKLNEG